MSRIRHKLKLHQDILDINKKLLAYDLSTINVIFIVKGNEVCPSTLKKIKNKYPEVQLINWSLDDMYAWHNRSLFYTLSLKYYDHVFTTKTYNLQELPSIGAKKVHFINQAYSRDIHKPHLECIENPKYDVVFIGFPEKERFASLQYLAQNGIKIDIFGYALEWQKIPYANHHENLILHAKGVYGEEYAQTLGSAKISLCFLRKINRDLHTSRSVEIPACGGFMLAERTSEHSDLFTENQEAVYFSSDQELVEKVNYYLEHDEERKSIAENGLSRCQTSGYSYDNMVDKILKNLDA
jgi:glycosyltransferase involved in cell wall biosynthesis